MNLGITLLLGLYGVVSAVYSEVIKPDVEVRGGVLAFEITFVLALGAVIVELLKIAHNTTKNDRE